MQKEYILDVIQIPIDDVSGLEIEVVVDESAFLGNIEVDLEIEEGELVAC